MESPGFFDLCYGEQDKLLKPIYNEWRGDWLTEKSWKRYSEEHLRMSQNVPQMTVEEMAEEEKEEQRHARQPKPKTPNRIHAVPPQDLGFILRKNIMLK